MNPETNRFEPLTPEQEEQGRALERMITEMTNRTTLLRPDGTPVPDTWIQFRVGENVEIKGYTFVVVYIGESNILFEPVGPSVIAAQL